MVCTYDMSESCILLQLRAATAGVKQESDLLVDNMQSIHGVDIKLWFHAACVKKGTGSEIL